MRAVGVAVNCEIGPVCKSYAIWRFEEDDARQNIEHRPHTLRGPDAIALGFLDGVLVAPHLLFFARVERRGLVEHLL